MAKKIIKKSVTKTTTKKVTKKPTIKKAITKPTKKISKKPTTKKSPKSVFGPDLQKRIDHEKNPKPLTKTLDEQCAENPVVKKIVDATNEIIDPEIGIGIVDLGLIYGVTLNKRHAIITMTLTSMGCPVGPMIVEQIETLVPQIVEEIDHADVVIVWDPAWNPDRMKPDVRDMLFNF